MGMLWDLIQRHIDSQQYGVSERQVAAKLGVAPNALKYWRDPKKLPSRENLQAIADLVGVRYSVVLDAALRDTGYHEESAVAVLRPRPAAIVEAELRVAEETLADWDEQKVPGRTAKSHRAELQARVDDLRAELSSSRQVTGDADSVAEL
jgi:transcriptional regulator with XRE-family HTH domain